MREPSSALKDRTEAGTELARQLTHLRAEGPVVLALPRGGVPVGFEIARWLPAPLDILIVRKIGSPGNPEYGLGAIVEGGHVELDVDRMREGGYSLAELRPVIDRELREAERRASVYRSVRPRVGWKKRTVIVVDDGAATGGTLFAAIRAVRAQGAGRVVVAVGVAPPDTCHRLNREADELHVLREPANFHAVGEYYQRFDPVNDDEVLELLRQAGTVPS
ncbi:MAG: phosphoribosyltransferase [Thermoplasmata archaeon]|nr:phosphoribosyltransferase [Thermoplasmata archaeon]